MGGGRILFTAASSSVEFPVLFDHSFHGCLPFGSSCGCIGIMCGVLSKHIGADLK